MKNANGSIVNKHLASNFSLKKQSLPRYVQHITKCEKLSVNNLEDKSLIVRFMPVNKIEDILTAYFIKSFLNTFHLQINISEVE